MEAALKSTLTAGSDTPVTIFSYSVNTKLVKFSESQVIAGLKERKEHIFSYLYDNYAAAFMGVIFRKVNNRQCAEDLLQEVFEKIWRNIDSYDCTKGRLFTWMIKLTVNHTLDFVRSKNFNNNKLTSGEEKIEKDTLCSGLYKSENFDCICIKKNIATLNPEFRQLINMAYFHGLTQNEISIQLNMPLGTVKTKLRNAIIELRKKTGEML